MTANRPAPRGALLSRLRLPVHCAIIITAIATLLPVVPLKARELIVDQRNTSDTTTYKTLKAAAAALQPGDTLVIAKGSGPYRETLRIQKSGTPEAPITIEGNGETITGFVPLDSFQRADNNAAAPHIARLPHPWPLVLAYQGRRVLQNPATGRLEIPSFPASALTLHDDNQTIELAPGTPTTGWETSTLTNAVQLRDVSYHTYRNLTATGALNDGFNLHGAGTGLLFENITAAQNLDEGFSAHGTIECEIRGGDFWGNDNGLGNVAQSRLRATDLRLHHNLGWGLWLGGQACADLTRVSAWNNGATQIRFDQNTTGTCTDVLAWPPAWTHTRPWTAYKEAARQTKSIPLVGLARTATAQWNGLPRLVTASSDLPPVTSDIHLPKPVAQTLDPEPTAAATLTRLILSAAAAGQKNVRLPAGIHKLDSTLEFKKLKNIEIDGTGVTLLMTRTHRQTILRLRECADITLRGLTLDYAPLPFTQATVTRATRTPDGDTLIEFSIHDGYPDLTPDYAKTSAHFFTPDGRRHPGSYDLNRLADLHPLSPRLGQARLSRHLPSDLAPGDMIALDRRSLDGAGAVAVHTATGPVTFEDITLHASPGMGFLGRYCTDTVTFRRVTIRPGPPPPGATPPPPLSPHFHFSIPYRHHANHHPPLSRSRHHHHLPALQRICFRWRTHDISPSPANRRRPASQP
ncbi:hypothetical protein Ga0100230_007070 [Opitutaceae bacterium TAV3]|nr:hypothetical protein Ga0100230_007070 [Opitutaceae bacterium TAV3]